MRRLAIDQLTRPPAAARRWLARDGDPLLPYLPPIGAKRFWAVQALVLAIAAVHVAVEATGIADVARPGASSLSFVPTALFFLPVVYAALSFGSAGAISTAAWCTVLALPNLLVFHTGLGRAGEMFQLGMVDVIAIFAGQRVDRESDARRLAEAATAASRDSETKYRALFESSPCAILLVDPVGVVQEANPAAAVLFQAEPAELPGTSLADLVGTANAEKLLVLSHHADRNDRHIVLKHRDGTDVHLEPAFTPLLTAPGAFVTQVLLRDVTADQQREAGLRAYAAHVLRAQEEERKRIAQELHDETVQRMVLLCRQLDYIANAGEPLPPTANAGLLEARRSAEETVESLRDFARDLRPPTLDDLGLVECIRRLLEQVAEREKSEIALKVVGQERRLAPEGELATFRIAQQALRNVERHAKATRVTVSIAFANGRMRLTVVDNGVGFTLRDDMDLAAAGHLGLIGMRERAEMVGGWLRIRTEPGRGTAVAASIPTDEGTSGVTRHQP